MEVVEFFGLPGAGKSTLLREVIGTADGAGKSVVDLDAATLAAIRLRGADRLTRAVATVTRSSSERAWQSAYARSTDRFAALTRSMAANPQVMEIVLAAQRRRQGSDLDREGALSWIIDLMARFQLACEAEELFDWLFIDEGFCQRAILLFDTGFAGDVESLLHSYVAAIVPGIVIVVEASPSVCEPRLDERGWPKGLNVLNDADRRKFLNTAERLVELVTAELERVSAHVIHVDGTAPIGESRNALIRELAM